MISRKESSHLLWAVISDAVSWSRGLVDERRESGDMRAG